MHFSEKCASNILIKCSVESFFYVIPHDRSVCLWRQTSKQNRGSTYFSLNGEHQSHYFSFQGVMRTGTGSKIWKKVGVKSEGGIGIEDLRIPQVHYQARTQFYGFYIYWSLELFIIKDLSKSMSVSYIFILWCILLPYYRGCTYSNSLKDVHQNFDYQRCGRFWCDWLYFYV